MSLYNALYDENLTDTNVINKLKVEDILYKNFKNDISFEIKGKVLVFGEHQSTVNPNMPLRCLMYAGRAYEQLVNEDVRYRRNLVKIVPPEFYVFYNGDDDAPKEKSLKLSNAYICPISENSAELVVKVININSNKKHEILKKCKILNEYTFFIEAVKKRKNNRQENAIKGAIYECISKNILSEYLQRKGSEVVNMLTAEYSYEKDLEIAREEARELEKISIVINMLTEGTLSIAQIAYFTGISQEKIEQIKKENNL